MRMKEAQTLGILAMIAVGIILLCMWGGGASTEDPSEMADRLADSSMSEQGDRAPADTERETEILPEPVSEQEQIDEELGGDFPNRTQENDLRNLQERDDPESIDMQSADEQGTEPERPRQPRYHVVTRGDTLSTISTKYYGTGKYWKKLARVNRDVCPNPRKMSVGMRLHIPYKDEITGSEAVASRQSTTEEEDSEQAGDSSDGRVYVVQKGDSLYKIAKKEYGDGGKYKAILKKNRDVVRDGNVIMPGMKLRLPNL